MEGMNQQRMVGIDLGKRTYELKAIHPDGKVTGWNGTTDADGRKKLCERLEETDRVAIEAGNLTFVIAKEIISEVGCEVVVLNASKLAIIYASLKKTDKEDALKLARLVQRHTNEELPVVRVPTDAEMYRRELVSSHRETQHDRTMYINRLHVVFLKAGISTMRKRDLKIKKNREAVVKMLSKIYLDKASYYCKLIDMCEEHAAELRALMEAEEKGDAEMQRLETVAGVGLVTALAFQAYIGDVKRFENASQVANFVGFVPRVDISCSIVKYGSITKRGNGYLRTLLVMSAWSMVRSKNGGMLKAKYEYMTKCKGLSKKKAIVAIARKLTELLYALLKNGEDYKPVQTQKVLRKTAAELATEALGMAG